MEWLCVVASTVLLVVLSLLWRAQQAKKPPVGSKLLPSPPGSLLRGHVEYLRPHFAATKAIDWSCEYGPVYRIRTGLTNMVVLNNLKAIKSVFSRDELLYRSKEWRIYGIDVGYPVSLEGEAWAANRKFCLASLKNLGLGKPSIGTAIVSECHRVIEKIAGCNGRAIAIEDIIVASVSNNTALLIFGERYDLDDPTRKWLDETLRNLLVAVNTVRWRISPLGHFKSPNINRIAFPGRRNIEKCFGDLGLFMRNKISAYRSFSNKTSHKTLIADYMEEMERRKENIAPFSVENLMNAAIGYFVAGSQAVPAYLYWHMLNCALRPDTVQAKLQDEIDRVIGPDAQPNWEHRNSMPFTMAVIWEMFRWKLVAPLSAPRRAGVDFVHDGLLFPNGITVMANIWAVHNDPNVWPHPENFDPGRFIKEDGSAICHMPEQLITFSVGKRKCPAETQAIMLLFFYLVCILQEYRVLPEEGVHIDPGDALDRLPTRNKYLLRFISRSKKNPK